jgi:Ankyrin repeats (many copies)
VLLAYVEGGASPDGRDDDGRTLLMHAVRSGYFDLVRALLDAGADPTVQDAKGVDALALARSTTSGERLAVLEAALDSELSTPEDRVAAYDRVDATRAASEARRAEAAKDAKEREQRAQRVSESIRRYRDKEARRSSPAPRSPPAPPSNPPSKKDPFAQWSKKTPDPPKPGPLPPICYEPEVAACRARGVSCDECAMRAITSRAPEQKKETRCFGTQYVACGSVCCGTGYICCQNRLGDSCRPRSMGCKSWEK